MTVLVSILYIIIVLYCLFNREKYNNNLRYVDSSFIDIFFITLIFISFMLMILPLSYETYSKDFTNTKKYPNILTKILNPFAYSYYRYEIRYNEHL